MLNSDNSGSRYMNEEMEIGFLYFFSHIFQSTPKAFRVGKNDVV